MIAAVAAAGGYLAHGFNQRLLAAAFVGLVGVGALLIGALCAFPLRAAIGWVLGRIAPSGHLFGLPTPAPLGIITTADYFFPDDVTVVVCALAIANTVAIWVSVYIVAYIITVMWPRPASRLSYQCDGMLPRDGKH